MRRSTLIRALGLGLVAMLVLPASGFADATDLNNSIAGRALYTPTVGIDAVWVIVAASLVMFMQAGLAFLEIGFSRAKNAGLDISEHGMYGYPEQFIPPAELIGFSPTPVTAMSASPPTATTKEAFTS
jgi:hypothetical protein